MGKNYKKKLIFLRRHLIYWDVFFSVVVSLFCGTFLPKKGIKWYYNRKQ
jgi:hypothetical protein